VNRFGAGAQGGREDGVLVQVALGDGRRARSATCLVREAHVPGVGVRLGADGDTGDAALAKDGGDSAGDLAPIGDEDFAEGWHGRAC
jgi:hypothetical protein